MFDNNYSAEIKYLKSFRTILGCNPFGNTIFSAYKKP